MIEMESIGKQIETNRELKKTENTFGIQKFK